MDLEDGEIAFDVTPRAAFGNIFKTKEFKKFEGVAMIDEYELLEKVGEGTFGEVYKARHKRTGEIVAVKKILMTNEKEGFPITALREIKILKQVSHPNVIRLKEIAISKSELIITKFEGNFRDISMYMIFPFMDYDLAGLLDSPDIQFTLAQIKYFISEILSGLVYLHQAKFRILHRDIKSANILISSKGEVKIADFGLARPVDERRRNYTGGVVTRWYRPPELLLGSTKYNEAVDIWGIGCIFGEMITKKPILMGKSDFNQIEVICQLCGTPTEENYPSVVELPDYSKLKLPLHSRKIKEHFSTFDQSAVDLLDKLLVLDPKKRLTAVEALNHDFFVREPLPMKSKDMPQYKSVHEYSRRKVKQEEARKVYDDRRPMPANDEWEEPRSKPQNHYESSRFAKEKQYEDSTRHYEDRNSRHYDGAKHHDERSNLHLEDRSRHFEERRPVVYDERSRYYPQYYAPPTHEQPYAMPPYNSQMPQMAHAQMQPIPQYYPSYYPGYAPPPPPPQYPDPSSYSYVYQM